MKSRLFTPFIILLALGLIGVWIKSRPHLPSTAAPIITAEQAISVSTHSRQDKPRQQPGPVSVIAKPPRELTPVEKEQKETALAKARAAQFLGHLNREWNEHVSRKADSATTQVDEKLTPEDILARHAILVAEIKLRTGYEIYHAPNALSPQVNLPMELTSHGPFKFRPIP